MTSSVKKNEPVTSPTAQDRREKLLRDLKLALVDQQVRGEAAGCNPYDALQGRGRPDRWDTRKR